MLPLDDAIISGLDGQRFKLSDEFQLEACLSALDLEDPSMDRGAIMVDGVPLWVWRDTLLNTPPSPQSVSPNDFAVTAMHVFLNWLLLGRPAQDTLLCLPPLLRPSVNNVYSPIAKAIWYLVNHVVEEIYQADFDKDESVLSRQFYGKRPVGVYEPVETGIQWLDSLQSWFHERRYFAQSIDIPLPFLASPVLFEPLLSNTFGIGCPRRTTNLVLIGTMDILNQQLKTMHHHLSILGRSPLLTVTEVIDGTVSLSSSCCQFVRATFWNILSALYLDRDHPGSIWSRLGPLQDHEVQLITQLFKILIHAPARSHRLLRKLLANQSTCTRSPLLQQMWTHVKIVWIRTGLELQLMVGEKERQEAQQWLHHLSSPSTNPPPNSPLRAFSHRWSCLKI